MPDHRMISIPRRFRRPALLRRPLVAAWLTLLLAAPVALQAAHPYYERQLDRGSQALAREDYAAATRSLRLAAFGLLDEPTVLARCLVGLALAERGAGDVAATRETVDRVLDLEGRFGAYSDADLEADLAARFTALLVDVVPAERLRSVPAFHAVARRKTAAELDALPPSQQAERLEELMAAEPEAPLWPLMLARLEQVAGRSPRAISLADRVLALRPEESGAFCVRGLAHAGATDCAAAALDLARCDRTLIDPAIAWTHLDCLVETERWRQASALVSRLPPALRSERRFRKLVRQVERNLPASTAANEEAANEEAASEQAADTPDADRQPAPPASSALSDADAERLRRAREELGRARTSSDLALARSLAGDVAERNPGSRQAQRLAGELAYRASSWSEAVRYFHRAGISTGDRPELLFYYAVALWESGEPAAAAVVLEQALPRLRRTPFVDGYIEKILGESAG